MASYSDPKPSDTEIIEAIRYHFPISVQRAMVSMRLTTIEGALHLQKRIELTETQEL
jgi:hypothetical protein